MIVDGRDGMRPDAENMEIRTMIAQEITVDIAEFAGKAITEAQSREYSDNKQVNRSDKGQIVIRKVGTVEHFANRAEAESATEWPGDAEILKTLNASRTAGKRSTLYQQGTKALRAAYEQTDEFKTADLIDTIMKNGGKSRQEAEALAQGILGASFKL